MSEGDASKNGRRHWDARGESQPGKGDPKSPKPTRLLYSSLDLELEIPGREVRSVLGGGPASRGGATHWRKAEGGSGEM